MNQDQLEEEIKSLTPQALVVDTDLLALRDPMDKLALLDSQDLVELLGSQVILECQGMPESLDHLDLPDLLDRMETAVRRECLEYLDFQVAA
jgi:hypothetical protein